MDGKQIYENFRNGDTAGLRSAATQVQQLSAAYLERAQGIRDLQDRMAKSWTGGAADAAKAGAGPLELAFHDTADPLDMTTASVDMQASSFENSSHSVVEVPPKPDKPNPWTTGLKAAIPIAGPFMAAGDEKSYQDSLNRYNTANETNVRVMDQYNGVTTSTKSVLPTVYGTLEPDGAAISLKTPVPPGHVGPPATGKPARTGGGSGQGATPAGGSVVPGGGSGGHTVPGSAPGGGHHGPTGGGTTGSAGGGTTGAAGGGTTGDTTTSQGSKSGPSLVTPPAPGVDAGGGRANGPGGSAVFVPGGPGGQNPSGVTDPEGGLGGRGGAGGIAERGVGSRSGVGGMGGAAAQDAAAARAAQGRAGAAGGPMGAGGRRGEGGEDEEHQRPDYLVEADPDAIFGTDQRTSPPVIGE
ncbi:hypothetical protein [Amycolatopsis saalfeldensis]|uniref:PPE family protein n=1 Tax=Amycolatopsis saalfeldensis TaxID=394193 RepID=A0A1H8SJZ2_9PSEU|nr:hypothetical protein [Amycolatopsis saalfeldensis]SEO78513.1 hypothetical protein SAMN04489732_102140 [Amycolatopsis saalfeldensis]